MVAWLMRQNLNFRHVHFPWNFCRIQVLQETQEWKFEPTYLFTECVRLPSDNHANTFHFYCKAVARILRNVQLPLKFALLMHGHTVGIVQHLSLSCESLASWGSLACKCEIIVQASYCCRTFSVDLCGLYACVSNTCKIVRPNNHTNDVKSFNCVFFVCWLFSKLPF